MAPPTRPNQAAKTRRPVGRGTIQASSPVARARAGQVPQTTAPSIFIAGAAGARPADQSAAENEDIATEQQDDPDGAGDHRRNGHHRLGAKISEKHRRTSHRIALAHPAEFDPCPGGSSFIIIAVKPRGALAATGSGRDDFCHEVESIMASASGGAFLLERAGGPRQLGAASVRRLRVRNCR